MFIYKYMTNCVFESLISFTVFLQLFEIYEKTNYISNVQHIWGASKSAVASKELLYGSREKWSLAVTRETL